jgi:mRNA interferase MazF
MSIRFVPHQGMVLMCDFDTGFVPPEMTKVRHVVVISPRHRRNTGSCLVVPLSTVAPNPVEPFHYRIPANTYSFFRNNTDVWAKADLLSHVSFGRLDRVLDGGKYCSPSLNPLDLKAIQQSVWEALGRPALQMPGNTVLEVVEAQIETTKIVVDNLPKRK